MIKNLKNLIEDKWMVVVLKFNEKAKLISDVDEQTRWIIKICNDELTRSLPQNREALIKNIEFEE
jgi:hypothetical protein